MTSRNANNEKDRKSPKASFVRTHRLKISIFIFGLTAVCVALYFVFQSLNAPLSQMRAMVNVEIKVGMNNNQIASLLLEKRAIRSKPFFAMMAKLTGKSVKLKAGEYEIDASNTSWTILKRVVDGKSVLHKVTVPEGFSVAQIARLIASKGLSDEQSLLMAARAPELLNKFGIKGRDAEGYMMPETYSFRKDSSADEIVNKMVSLFFTKVKPIVAKYQAGSKQTLHEILTLASIIEKEAANQDEFPIVSAVFHNRLHRGMLLQADPTVIYATPDYDGTIHKKDLSIDSPYNTYKYYGLPPGPIANPSLRAIEAAYAPKKVKFLYFVAMGKGKGHYFSSSLKEHNKAVKKYITGGV
jgi:UPF0755 protein